MLNCRIGLEAMSSPIGSDIARVVSFRGCFGPGDRLRGEAFSMRATARTLIICRLTFTLFAIWIWTAQPASAGDGGADLGGLQAIIGPPDGSDGLCSFLGMSPCPQL